MDAVNKKALEKHRQLHGKIGITAKDSISSAENLKYYYTPGVGAVSSHVAKNPEQARDYTWTNNAVAIVSDGSAVLGLGDLGPLGALPVMEGKSMLFKKFSGIDGIPIVLNAHTADEIVSAVKAIAPTFGAINLEDIAAPTCFEVEERLKNELNIPVMHDDQHGTAVVVLAGLINAMRVVGKNLSECRVVLVGAGAAGVAIAKLLYLYAKPQIIAVDSKGIIEPSREGLNKEKRLLLEYAHNVKPGQLTDAVQNADVFIGVSQPGLLTAEMVGHMAKNAVVFALANPVPEIYPENALAAGAAVVATGRSDFPNQVNNALAFPGIFRGALDNNVGTITDEHKIKAAEAIAAHVQSPRPDLVIPSIFATGLSDSVAHVIR